MPPQYPMSGGDDARDYLPDDEDGGCRLVFNTRDANGKVEHETRGYITLTD